MNVSKKIKFITCVLLLFSADFLILSASSLSEGEKLFRENQPLQASQYLEKAVSENPKNPSAYNLLGLSYYQLGKYPESVEVLIRGTTFPSNMRYLLYYNAGNAAFAMGDFNKAEEYFTASYTLKNDFASSVLNRANSRMKMNQMKKACEDYRLYLQLDPYSAQRSEIERLIGLISQEYYAQEKEKADVEKEEDILKSELERLLFEKENSKLEQELKLKKEAERRKRLLDEIAASLEDTDSKNFSAGSEGVEEYEQNSKLD